MNELVLRAVIQMLKEMTGEDLIQLNNVVQKELQKRGELPNGF